MPAPAPVSAASPYCCSCADLIHGALRHEITCDGWIRPWRFYPAQCRALESCLAWYPGIYRAMATCTSGVRLEFETDASELSLEIKIDEESQATRNVLKGVDGAGPAYPHDMLALDVDNEHVSLVLPHEQTDRETYPRGAWGPSISCSLELEAHTGDLLQLPGFGTTHAVRLWLPALRGCELRNLVGNGTFIRPTSLYKRRLVDEALTVGERTPRLLVLGDSVAQGFVVEDPSCAWPSLVADSVGYDLLNQSVGGQVFQPTALAGLGALETPDTVIVAFGGNYRYGRCSELSVRRDMEAYLHQIDTLWPSALLLVVIPHVVKDKPIVRGSCYASIAVVLDEVTRKLTERRQARGYAPVVTVSAPNLSDPSFLADADGHLSASGAQCMAETISEPLVLLQQDLGCSELNNS